MLTMDHAEATTDPVDVDDLAAAGTPLELDPEAALLCALLHSARTDEVQLVTGHLTASDFHHLVYGHLFQVIADLVAADQPHHAPRVLSALRSAGRLAGHHGDQLARALREVALLGTPALAVHTLALDVLEAAYRRRFHAAVRRQAQAATEAPTDDLFDLMVDEGRAMRREWTRLQAFRAGPADETS